MSNQRNIADRPYVLLNVGNYSIHTVASGECFATEEDALRWFQDNALENHGCKNVVIVKATNRINLSVPAQPPVLTIEPLLLEAN